MLRNTYRETIWMPEAQQHSSPWAWYILQRDTLIRLTWRLPMHRSLLWYETRIIFLALHKEMLLLPSEWLRPYKVGTDPNHSLISACATCKGEHKSAYCSQDTSRFKSTHLDQCYLGRGSKYYYYWVLVTELPYMEKKGVLQFNTKTDSPTGSIHGWFLEANDLLLSIQ